MNFKEQVERDLKEVFHNTGEHAATKEIQYGGDFFKVPAVLDNVAVADRTQLANDKRGRYLRGNGNALCGAVRSGENSTAGRDDLG